MKKSLWKIIILAACMAFPVAAYAENVQGEVQDVTPDASSLTLKPKAGANAGLPPVLAVSIKPETRFEGLSSLKDLAAGDEVTVEANKKGEDAWEAESVKISKVKIREPIAKLEYPENKEAKK